MGLQDLFREDLMVLDLKPAPKKAVLEQLAKRCAQAGAVEDAEAFAQKLWAREEQSTTGVGDEIAIPHAQDASIKEAVIVFARCEAGLAWEALDNQPVKLVYLIAVPAGSDNAHLQALSQLSSVLMKPGAKEQFLQATSPSAVKQTVVKLSQPKDEQTAAPEETRSSARKAAKPEAKEGAYLLAVTACPTGIAHTYMAEEKLRQAAEKRGLKIKVETNGQVGVEHPLTAEDIQVCDAIIVAADRNVEMTRFAGKPVLVTSVGAGINHADELLDRALSGDLPIYEATGDIESQELGHASGEKESLGRQAYKHLMNGVSHMLPFVVAGGLLIALSFFWGINSADPTSSEFNAIAHFLKTTGGLAFAMMLPVLAGFIGRSLADTPGLVIGMMGGVLANPSILTAFSAEGLLTHTTSSGFLGAIVAGFLAGGIVRFLRWAFSWLPKALNGMKPILLFPVFGVLIMAVIMLLVVNGPLGLLSQALVHGLSSVPREFNMLLGFIVAAMMSIDMGGPINKAAYVTGTALVSEAAGQGSDIMAAVMIGGMVPPLAIALSSTLKKDLWPVAQKNSALVNYVMGAAFITEGAIPFAASKPLRVIPSLAIASGLAGALSMLFDCVSYVPHGGIFAVFANGVTHPVLYLLAWLIGGIVGAILLIIFLRDKESQA